MKITKFQSGFTAIHALLFLFIIGIIGFTGWKVYDADKSSKSPTTSAVTPIVKTDDTKPTVATIPIGFTAYENKELGFKFAYPKEWGSVKVTIAEGSADPYPGDGPNIPGTGSYVGSFSSNEKFRFAVSSTVYRIGGRGGFSPIAFIDYCKQDNKIYGQYATGGCKTEEGYVKNPQETKLGQNQGLVFESIYGSDGSGGTGGVAYAAIVRLNLSKEFPTIVFEHLDIKSADKVNAVASTVQKLSSSQ